MEEDNLLEQTLEIVEQEGYEAAYEYLLEKKNILVNGNTSQILYFLSCLASGSGKSVEAIHWLEKAVVEQGYWYRPEIFEDNDFEPIYSEQEFLRCKEISEVRYQEAVKHASTYWTWEKKHKNDLMLCLHGNGQSAEISLESWRQLENQLLQVAALQSHTVDSCGRFRWNYDDIDYKQIIECTKHIMWDEYEHHYLTGFSAGCDMILRAITLSELSCNEVFLQSPWIPFSQDHMDDIGQAFKDKKIGVHLYCGEMDQDCLEMANQLYLNLQNIGVKSEIILQKELRHQLPKVMNDEYQFFI